MYKNVGKLKASSSELRVREKFICDLNLNLIEIEKYNSNSKERFSVLHSLHPNKRHCYFFLKIRQIPYIY